MVLDNIPTAFSHLYFIKYSIGEVWHISLNARINVERDKNTFLDNRIKINFENENRNRTIRAESTINPLLSCFVNDCLKRGTDIECGGALYNWIMPSFVGISNLVDSLCAIKTLVFDETRFTLCELKSILKNNFEDNEALRLYILNHIPKYGNDIDEVDSLYSLFTEHIAEECQKYNGLFENSKLIPSIFCWIIHENFGRETITTGNAGRSYNEDIA